MIAHKRGHSHHSHRKVSDASYGLEREKEMVRNRIVLIVGTLTIAYFLNTSIEIFYGLIGHLLASLTVGVSYRFQPNPSDLRRLAGLLTDFGTGYYLFSVGGETAAIFYPLFLWVILGYGFRFGNKWLLVAAAMGSLSFGLSIFNVPFWQENTSLAIGLLAGLLVVPGYCSTLITKLSQAKEEAEEANKAKTLFLASISHELRTPLNAIIGYGTHMMDMDLQEQPKQMVATSVSAGRHLLHLINQLLSFAKSESTDELPEPQEFRPTDILAEVRDIMQIAASEKDLELNLQAEIMSDQLVVGQSDYVKNILINLTSNAIKFTDTGSVLLQCGLKDLDGQNTLWCSVTDTGPGVADEAKEKIFEVFQQADASVSKKFGGTGLGLAICRQLAQQLSGEVTLKSEVGVGSTFTFSCPVALEADQADSADSGVMRILSIGRVNQPPEIGRDEDVELAVRHICLDSSSDPVSALKGFDLNRFDLALISSDIANDIRQTDPFWKSFVEAKLPPVLISDQKSPSLDEICLRASFASVLPTSPGFDSLRSAVQIGCSFNSDGTVQDVVSASVSQAIEPRKILVADDNRTNLMVLETILVNAGHEVILVSDGEQALQKLENDQYDIVFLDVNMPKLGGIECCKMWRQIEGPHAHVPMIALTADSTEETERKCLDAGMDLRLTKPIEAGSLLQAIAEQTSSENMGEVSDRSSDPFETVQSIDEQNPVEQGQSVDPSQLDYLLSIGDQEFVQSIIDAYIDDAREILVAFKLSVEQENVDDFRFHAHAFKSGANNIGANKLSEMCGKLEVITEGDFGNHRHKYLEQINREIESVEAYLQSESLNLIQDADADLDQTGTV